MYIRMRIACAQPNMIANSLIDRIEMLLALDTNEVNKHNTIHIRYIRFFSIYACLVTHTRAHTHIYIQGIGVGSILVEK